MAEQIDFLLSDYRHPSTGEALALGKVYTYIAGTSTLTNLWTDADKGGNADNPIILSEFGTADVYGDGFYKFRIYDANDLFVEELYKTYYKSDVTSDAIFQHEHDSLGNHISPLSNITVEHNADGTHKAPLANFTVEHNTDGTHISGSDNFDVEHNTDGTHSDVTADTIIATNDTGTNAIYVNQTEVLQASNHALHLYSNAVQINSALAKFEQDNTSSSASTLILQQDGTGHCEIININGNLATSRYGLKLIGNVAQTNSELLYVHSDHAGSTASVAKFLSDGTGSVVSIQPAGVLDVDSSALKISSDTAQINSELLEVYLNNTSATADMSYFQNKGSGTSIKISSTTESASDKYGLHTLTSVAQTNSAGVLIQSTHASTTKPGLQVSYAGNDKAIAIYNSNANGYALFSQNADTTGYNSIFYNAGGVVGSKGIAVQTGTDDASGLVYYVDCLDGNGDYVGGLAASDGILALLSFSDETLKKNIADSELDFESIILNTKVRQYNNKVNGVFVESGLIAQEVERVFPQAVTVKPGAEKYIKKRARGDVIIPDVKDGEELDTYKLWVRDIDEREFSRKKMPGKFRVMEPEVKGIRKRKKAVSSGRYIDPLIMMAQKQAKEISSLKRDVNDLMKRIQTLENRG